MAIVYQVTNTVNGKTYIGVTTGTLKKRWGEHCSFARGTGRQSQTVLCRAIRKYGVDSFIPEIIASVIRLDSISRAEMEVIKQRQPAYNQTNGGEWTAGKAMPEHSRQRMAEQKRALMAQRGSTYERCVEALRRGKLLVDESKRIQAVKAYWSTHKHTTQTRQKMSDTAKTNHAEERLSAFKGNRAKRVLCITDGRLFASAQDADKFYGTCFGSTWKVAAGRLQTLHRRTFQFVGGALLQ